MRFETITAAAAGTWPLADLTVRRMGFGAMRLTGSEPFGGLPSDRHLAIAVVRQAVDLGVNHIDTAAFYFSSRRSANELINSALGPYREDLVIATKVGPGRDPSGEWLPLARPEQLRGQVEENLRQLGRDHLDLVYLRQHGLESIADHFGALAQLRQEGLIRHLGLSNVRDKHLVQARQIAPVVAVQNAYGIDNGRVNDLVGACQRHAIAFVPFFALAGTAREKGGVAAGAAIDAVAAEVHATPAQIRLAWTLHRGPHVLAIPGTGNPDHLRENVAAAAVTLSEAHLAVLDTATE